MLAAYGDIVSATRLPVSGDLENSYGESPGEVDSTVLGSLAAVMVGGSIEDQGVVTGNENQTSGKLIEHDLAVKRIRADRDVSDTLEDVGIRRVNAGGGLAHATFTLLADAANEMLCSGTFGYLGNAMPESDINQILDKYG